MARDIGGEIRDRSSALLGAFGLINSALSLCFLLVLLRVWLYRYKFLTRDHFDNRFITKAFRQLDWNRARQGMETVLPLTIKEQNKYITVSPKALYRINSPLLSPACMRRYLPNCGARYRSGSACKARASYWARGRRRGIIFPL